jgi:phosphatidylserine/phosphatidylglycerophosphate/cardiolipin synthase-like enzyme
VSSWSKSRGKPAGGFRHGRATYVALPAAVILALCSQGRSDPAPGIHYATIENLEHVDVALIDRAEHEIDMAAYVLTDWPVMQALTRAADRGVAIRIYLDGTQLAEREPAKVFRDLAETPGVEIRIKHENSDPVHLKSYEIDGRKSWLGLFEQFFRFDKWNACRVQAAAICDSRLK